MDRQARRYSTSPSGMLGISPGTWAAALVDTACRLSGLALFDDTVTNLQQKKALIAFNIPLTGGM